MRVAILGFGLIGGSIARALAGRGAGWQVAAWSPTGSGPKQARTDGVVDAAPDIATAVHGADLVVLGAPPLACLGLLADLAGPARSALQPDVVITDVASTKRALCARAAELGLPFVGGHPMAGTERTGYGAADPDLFVGRPWVVCPVPHAGGAARVERLARAVGANPTRLDPAEHDVAVAAVSHLPLVLSAALVEAVAGDRTGDWPAARALAAGGWSSMTRLSRGDVEMATGIAATNADLIADRLRAVRAVIDAWLEELDGPEPDLDALRRRFATAARLLD